MPGPRPLRGGAGPWRCRPCGPWGQALKQIHGLHFCRLPGLGREAASTGTSAPRSPLRRVTSLYGQRKKIIKKTYKITIEKVILLGETPRRLRGAFVLFSFFFFLNAVSLRPREYRLLAKSLAASWGSRPGGRGHGPGQGSGVPRAPGAQGTLLGWGEVPSAPPAARRRRLLLVVSLEEGAVCRRVLEAPRLHLALDLGGFELLHL